MILFLANTKREEEEKKQAKEDYVKAVINNLNEAWNGFMADPSQYFDESKLNALAQKQLSQEMRSASFASDALAFMDAKDHSIFQHLYTIASTGKMFEFQDQIKSFVNLSDQELTEAFPEQSADIKSGKMRERLNKMITRSEEVGKNYKKLNDKYINPFDKDKFTAGSREYNLEAIKQTAFNQAKFLMMFTKNTFERAVERRNIVKEVKDIYDTKRKDIYLPILDLVKKHEFFIGEEVTEEDVPASDRARRDPLVPGIQRAGRRLRPRGSADPGRPRRGRVRGHRAESLDLVRGPFGLDLLPGAHGSRRDQA